MAVTHGHGNPPWNRDETILALALYIQLAGEIPSSEDSRVRALSDLLRSLPYHAVESRKPSFRNAPGVAFKLMNLRQVATGIGLKNHSRMDEKVWREFSSRTEALNQAAARIHEGVLYYESLRVEEDGAEEFVEGRLLTELHVRRERDPRLRERLIAHRIKRGPLHCEICQCTTTIGDEFLKHAIFEVHHLVPIAEVGQRSTKMGDLALLCANCHRLVHRAIAREKRWLSIDEAKNTFGSGTKRADDHV